MAHVYIILAERILSAWARRLWLGPNRSLSLRLSLTHTPSPNLILRLDLLSSLSPRLGLSLIMIVKETERAEEKKEKQKKKQKQIIKRRNEKNIELDSPNVASEMPWRCPLLSFLCGC